MNRFRLAQIVLLTAMMVCSQVGLARGGHGGGGRGASFAHHGGGFHGRGGVGFFVGSPFWGYPFWPYYGSIYPYYYPPMTVPVPVPTQPPTYIEQEEGGDSLPPNSWYYCSNPPGYYPTVTDCPLGWQQVAPR